MNDIKEIQVKILEVMKYIDQICRENKITYYIMGGTAIGAIRHKGFIPWDDDLDIFMTPTEFYKFKVAVEKDNNPKFIIQEWKTSKKYVEYAKVRMNGTTFIEEAFINRKDLHQGIYVDIMILHKVSQNKAMQRIVYFESKFVTLYGNTQRNWKPKNKWQKIACMCLKVLPCELLADLFYRRIYLYENLQKNFMYCYWITRGKFQNGLFPPELFSETMDVEFENTRLMASTKIKEYLSLRYGDYMKIPSEEERMAFIHAYIVDTEKDYTEYINDR